MFTSSCKPIISAIIGTFCVLIGSLLYSGEVDQYWVSFNGFPRDIPHAPGGPKFLMKIDHLGQVLVPPVKVIANSRFFVSPQVAGTALSSRGKNFINIWVPDTEELSDGQNSIFRVIFDKRTRKVRSISRTPLRTWNSAYIQVTQKEENNFLGLQVRDPVSSLTHKGFGISSFGAVLPQIWLLTQEVADCFGCGTAVSADGRVFIFTDFRLGRSTDRNRLILQRLTLKGRILGKSVVLAVRNSLTPLDVTNRLHQGRRYVIYTEGSPAVDSPLFLQIIDLTGEKIGARVPIALHVGSFQNAAIDPLGRFMVYVALRSETSLLENALVFQALDGTGRPSGSQKVLVRTRVADGIDILKE